MKLINGNTGTEILSSTSNSNALKCLGICIPCIMSADTCVKILVYPQPYPSLCQTHVLPTCQYAKTGAQCAANGMAVNVSYHS